MGHARQQNRHTMPETTTAQLQRWRTKPDLYEVGLAMQLRQSDVRFIVKLMLYFLCDNSNMISSVSWLCHGQI
jgi:hypothetical protein